MYQYSYLQLINSRIRKGNGRERWQSRS